MRCDHWSSDRWAERSSRINRRRCCWDDCVFTATKSPGSGRNLRQVTRVSWELAREPFQMIRRTVDVLGCDVLKNMPGHCCFGFVARVDAQESSAVLNSVGKTSDHLRAKTQLVQLGFETLHRVDRAATLTENSGRRHWYRRRERHAMKTIQPAAHRVGSATAREESRDVFGANTSAQQTDQRDIGVEFGINFGNNGQRGHG